MFYVKQQKFKGFKLINVKNISSLQSICKNEPKALSFFNSDNIKHMEHQHSTTSRTSTQVNNLKKKKSLS